MHITNVHLEYIQLNILLYVLRMLVCHVHVAQHLPL